MNTIHVAAGVGIAPTSMAAYDAALADANLHNYNLVVVSSVVPAEASVEQVDRVPDLGPAGNRLTVVQAETSAGPDTDRDRIAAGLGWATGPGPGLFYEVTGTDPDDVADGIRTGLDAGAQLRDWDLQNRDWLVESAEPRADAHTCVVVVAAYGESEPVL